jgi:hypothetical protein
MHEEMIANVVTLRAYRHCFGRVWSACSRLAGPGADSESVELSRIAWVTLPSADRKPTSRRVFLR